MGAEENKIQYGLILNWQPTELCNMRCRYCFRFTSTRFRAVASAAKASMAGVMYGMNKALPYLGIMTGAWRRRASGALPARVIPPIDIVALIAILDGTKKTVHISFSGGEPFLVPNILEASIAITQKHCIGFTTNLVTGKIKEFAGVIDPVRVNGILASLHMQELERLRLVKMYVENFHACQKNGITIKAAQVAYPGLLPGVDKHKLFFQKEGIAVSFTPFRGYYRGRRYPESYTQEELRVFGLDGSCRQLHRTRGRSCNSGVNVAIVSGTGAVYPCFNIDEELGNIYSGIKLKDTMTTCPAAFCKCPFFEYEKQLYKKALIETGH